MLLPPVPPVLAVRLTVPLLAVLVTESVPVFVLIALERLLAVPVLSAPSAKFVPEVEPLVPLLIPLRVALRVPPELNVTL